MVPPAEDAREGQGCLSPTGHPHTWSSLLQEEPSVPRKSALPGPALGWGPKKAWKPSSANSGFIDNQQHWGAVRTGAPPPPLLTHQQEDWGPTRLALQPLSSGTWLTATWGPLGAAWHILGAHKQSSMAGGTRPCGRLWAPLAPRHTAMTKQPGLGHPSHTPRDPGTVIRVVPSTRRPIQLPPPEGAFHSWSTGPRAGPAQHGRPSQAAAGGPRPPGSLPVPTRVHV